MDPNMTPDPVNRWATEHYGFDEEPTPLTHASSAAALRPRAQTRPSRPRRRSAWLAGGVLSVLLGAVGLGGFTMVANAADAGPGDGGRGAFVTGQVDRADDGRPDGAGTRGGPGNGDVGSFDGGRR
jgi:hypothetical protein